MERVSFSSAPSSPLGVESLKHRRQCLVYGERRQGQRRVRWSRWIGAAVSAPRAMGKSCLNEIPTRAIVGCLFFSHDTRRGAARLRSGDSRATSFDSQIQGVVRRLLSAASFRRMFYCFRGPDAPEWRSVLACASRVGESPLASDSRLARTAHARRHSDDRINTGTTASRMRC